MLAKNVNDDACFLNECDACELFASKLAPTEDRGRDACQPGRLTWAGMSPNKPGYFQSSPGH
ncbi:hypothetical protein DK871_07990 [Pseudomonas sp. L13]|nr:hypothetical protein [Pseudomonas sp. L13]